VATTKGKRACPVCGTLLPDDESGYCPVCALRGALDEGLHETVELDVDSTPFEFRLPAGWKTRGRKAKPGSRKAPAVAPDRIGPGKDC
jgi:hypothetical protein